MAAEAWQLLGEGLRAWRDRQTRESEFQRELALRQAQQEISKQAGQDTHAASEFELGEKKKAVAGGDALRNLDFSTISAPKVQPPSFVGPPEAPATFDTSKPWSAQDPTVQQSIIRQLAAKDISAPQVADFYNKSFGANTGQVNLPQTPPGLQLSEVTDPATGAKFQPNINTVLQGAKPQGPPSSPPGSQSPGGNQPILPYLSSIRGPNGEIISIPPPNAGPEGQPGMGLQPVYDAQGTLIPGVGRNPLTGQIEHLPVVQPMSEGDKALAVNIPELRYNLRQLRGIVKDYGTFEAPVPFGMGSNKKGTDSGKTSVEASSALAATAYKVAVEYAKLVDPATAAREGEVAAAQKYLLPIGQNYKGATANNEAALSQIDEMLKEIERRADAVQGLQQNRVKQTSLPAVSLFSLSPPSKHAGGTGNVPSPSQTGSLGQTQGSPMNPFRVTSQEEYDQLPPGAWYKDSSGRLAKR